MRKAAERLFVSQPALSQRLQSIEKQWGTSLFIRSPKGLTLTPAGEVIIQHARNVLQDEQRTKEVLQTLHSSVHGTLKIACASIVGQYWLPSALKQFVHQYPHVKISLLTGWSSEMMKAIYEGDVHLAIVRGTTDWKGQKIHLFKDSLYLVDKELTSLEELTFTERPFIQFKSDSTYFREIQDWWHRLYQSSPKQTIVVDQIETCKQLAYNGIGYAILPSITLHHEKETVFKTPLLDEKQEPIQRDTWLIGYESSFELPQVQVFVETVQSFLQE